MHVFRVSNAHRKNERRNRSPEKTENRSMTHLPITLLLIIHLFVGRKSGNAKQNTRKKMEFGNVFKIEIDWLENVQHVRKCIFRTCVIATREKSTTFHT
jgi:hypothetical protein